MAQRAALNFYPRVIYCIEANGGQFKHREFPKENPLFQFDVRNGGESESDGEDEGGEEQEEELGAEVENEGDMRAEKRRGGEKEDE